MIRCSMSKEMVDDDEHQVRFDPVEDGRFFMEAVGPARSDQIDWLLKRMADAAADPDAVWARCPSCCHIVQCFRHADHHDYLPHTTEGQWIMPDSRATVALTEMASPSITGGVITWGTA